VKAPKAVHRNSLHKSLWENAGGRDLQSLKHKWDTFVAKYPRFVRYERLWLHSRLGQSPLELEIPWINYSSFDWLKQWIRPEMNVFEWGCGGSTLFFAQKANTVVSVEHNLHWYKEVKKVLRSRGMRNVQLIHAQPSRAQPWTPQGYRSEVKGLEKLSFEHYVALIKQYPRNYFDFVLVDGRCRLACLRESIPFLKGKTGALMLDNSDYFRYQSALFNIESLMKSRHRKRFLSPGPSSQIIGWETTVWLPKAEGNLALAAA
jgi:hypothetical protein